MVCNRDPKVSQLGTSRYLIGSSLLGFFELYARRIHLLELCFTTKFHSITQICVIKEKRKHTGPSWDLQDGHTLGRVYTVHPNNTACYYLRMLLHTVPGPESFLDLKTVDNVVCDTFQLACKRLGYRFIGRRRTLESHATGSCDLIRFPSLVEISVCCHVGSLSSDR